MSRRWNLPGDNQNLFGDQPRPSADPESSGVGPSAQSSDAHSLYKYIDRPRVYASNVGPPGAPDLQEAGARCIKPWHLRTEMATWTESLDGNSMIINIPFSQTVRISSILINQGSGDEAPQRLRLYVNRPHGLDFDEVDDDAEATGAPSSGLAQADFLLRQQDTAVASAEDRIQEYPVARFAARFAHTQSIHVVLVS